MYNKTRQYNNRKFSASQHAIERSIEHLTVLMTIYERDHTDVSNKLLFIIRDLRQLSEQIDVVIRQYNL